jgi:hypothetical protein
MLDERPRVVRAAPGGYGSDGGSMLAIALWASEADAQVAIVHQPDPAAWYDEASGLLKSKTIADLSAFKAPIAPELAADLAKYDWLEAGTWNYKDRALTEPSPCQVNLRRYRPDGGELRFEYVAPCDALTKGQVLHLNFQDPPVTSASVVTRKDGVFVKTVSYGEAAFNRVIGYADGVLVVDVPADGKAGSKPSLRTVYVAMPQRFAWKAGE